MPLDAIRSDVTQDFGLGYVRFGHSELMGRVVGLLLATTTPLSEEQIAAELGVSKSPVNQITRRLEELALVRRVRRRGDRKYYYEIADHVFLQAGINQYRLYEETLQAATRHLEAVLRAWEDATDEERAELRVVGERLIRMREFHLRMIRAYRAFIDAWRADEAALPSLDDYLERGAAPLPAYSLETITAWPA